MKRGKKSGKRKRSAPQISRDEALAITTELEAGEPVEERRFQALVEHLRSNAEVTLLRELAPHADSPARLKLIKKALYRLDAALDRPTTKHANLGAQALPVLMSAPDTDATRIFTFAEPGRAGAVTVVEAYFCMPEGLFRLKSSPSTASAFVSWTKTMAAQGRATMPASLRPRKLWEIGEHARRGKVGNEFSPDVLKQLQTPSSPPPHPVYGHELGGVTPYSVGELRRRDTLRPFRHGSVEDVIRREAQSRGGALIRSAAAASWLDKSISEWASQWGYDHIIELFLDCALFHAETGDKRSAKAFLDVVTGSENQLTRTQVDTFLAAFMQDLLA